MNKRGRLGASSKDETKRLVKFGTKAEVIADFEEILEKRRAEGNQEEEAFILDSIGEMLIEVDCAAAIERLTEAAEIHRELGDRGSEVNSLQLLAEAQSKLEETH